ncbi:dihydropteroate synthase [Anaerocolumna sp. AGMB13025]|uniref:dihydropteroate synthase n=1 Tax=Anaerocolumna sp. AGMB13025 TaxID=3039116 RepID=UPI00241CAD7E|nr:dihydropteroate synthase [Anaerocolumna sp. AGMB13025]WFR59612.1 dihydropteroate synthase [Anaerocolumna sp. AGMB13025]
MLIGKKEFNLKENTHIMGILNVTPDSFSDGGKFNTVSKALAHANQLIDEGAVLIDVGGESTRPNHTKVSDEEEIERVVPVIKELKKNFDIPVSIDTYKSKVAQAALFAGADLVNDIWGLKYDKAMAGIISEYQVPVCLMHNRKEAVYGNYMEEVISDLQESIEIGLEAGIQKDKMIIDPGIGFGKTYEMNLILLNRLEELKQFKLPVLLGTSRKSVIGLTLDLPAEDRLEGTIATTVMGVMKGCSIIRVHDVLANWRAVKMTEAILKEHKE